MRRLPGRRTWENLAPQACVCGPRGFPPPAPPLRLPPLIIKNLLVAASSSEHCRPSGKACCPINYYNSSAWSSSYSHQLHHNKTESATLEAFMIFMMEMVSVIIIIMVTMVMMAIIGLSCSLKYSNAPLSNLCQERGIKGLLICSTLGRAQE